ncbi:exonuclease domain-containing protein [Fulvivirgaceae bacterium BMA10]|uniref:Exonuclease domain-containing protein n=1 Tax=Splendidivirga corallicola TaxID=3051826 RepID=A0ABT8KIZ2_9BACT|nr:exonuclease domain-containing protein [Fulvivirgaceae bacterium BMA10]
MVLNLKNPLSFFDLETTGTNITNDRIVEFSIIKMMVNGETITKTRKINPTIPIPLETSLIHGIYDEDVKDAPTFKSIAKELAKFLEGSDLAGFNILRFDVPILVEEFLRAGVDFEVTNRKLIDAQKIFHLMEKRNLSAAYKFYCNKELKDAHSAEADTKATLEVLESQVKKYEGQTVSDMRGNEIGVIKNDMAILHELTSSKMVDLAGRLILNDQGEEVFNFGKHKNRKISEVFKKEPSYYEWMMNGDFPLDTKRKLTEIKLRGFQR